VTTHIQPSLVTGDDDIIAKGLAALNIAQEKVENAQQVLKFYYRGLLTNKDCTNLPKLSTLFFQFCRTCLGTRSKNYWADCEEVFFSLKSIFFGSEKFQVSTHVLPK
jgi:hypothetical protein